jgi:uncharacterized protein
MAPARRIQLDTGMGRSAYLCQNLDCLTLAGKKNRLSRALKAPLSATIFAEISQQLEIRISHGKNGV